MIKKVQIIEKLKTCFDPEIPIDLWNLGLIYDIKIKKSQSKSDVRILMTLTTPGCSMITIIAEDVKSKIESLESIGEVNVDVTFDPPWSPEMITDTGKEKLGFSVSKNNTNTTESWE